MPTVQPPPPPPPTPATPQTSQAVAVAVKAPEAVSQLRPGQSLQATQVSQPTQAAQSTQAAPAAKAAQPTTPPAPSATQSLPANQVQVQTTLGPITLQTALPIPKGAVLTLVLNRLTPQPQFLITEINGKPVPGTQTALHSAGAPSLAANRASATPLSVPPLTEGMRINATLIRPATVPATVSTPSGIPTAPQTPAQPQVLAPTPTASANQPISVQTPSSAPAQTTSPGSPATPTTPPSSSGGVQPPPPSAAQLVQLPSGTRFTVSVVRIASPSTALNAATPSSGGGLAAGATLSGTVSGATPQGQPIVQTPNATIALETLAKINEGMRVTLKLESGPSLASTPNAAKLGHAGPAGTLAQAKSWSQLDEALKALSHIDPARFQHITQNVLPQPGAKLTSQMLFFLSALKGGDIKAWLGDNASKVIESGRPGIVSRLSSDMQIMSKLVDEPQSGDWRLALIPLWNGNQLEQLRMYYRNRSGQDDEDGEGDGTRFVLDVELSNLGHVQIDGLMKSQTKKLDLIVRTDQPFPDTWRTDLAEIFQTAQEITGIGGSLAFQAAPGNFIDFPPIEAPSPQRGLFV